MLGVRQKSTAGTVNNVRPYTLFTYTFAMQTCCCVEPPPSMAVLIRCAFIFVQHAVDAHTSSAFAKRRRRYKELAENKAQARSKCTSLHILTCEICISQISFLCGTTALLGRFDTSRIYCSTATDGGSDTLRTVCSSGMDAARINQKRCFAVTRNS